VKNFLATILTLPLSKKRFLHNPNLANVECTIAQITLPIIVVVATAKIATEIHPKY